MHDSRILEDVTSSVSATLRKVYVVRRIEGDKILSPFRKNTTWVVGEKQTLKTTLKELEQRISTCVCEVGAGVFHSHKYLEDAIACAVWLSYVEVYSDVRFVVFEALAEGIIGKGINDDDEVCYFSTELTLLAMVYPEELPCV